MVVHNFAPLKVFVIEMNDAVLCLGYGGQELLLYNFLVRSMTLLCVLHLLLVLQFHHCYSLFAQTEHDLVIAIIIKI